MVFDTRRPIPGRTALGLLAVGAALALSACGAVPLLPPALSDGRTLEPEPTETSSPEPRPTPPPEPTHTPEPTESPGPEYVSVFALEEGDCVAEFEGREGISQVPVVHCDEPHLYEIYYAGDLDGDEYPGEEEVISMTSERCGEEFEDFVGVEPTRSELAHRSLFPTEDGWNEDDDREILCLVHERNGDQVAGSLEGARR
ncbi:septum formation family protein [Nocardiopsis lucentensis]|uniref:septum formation family protein n=1 Tax=Nocardiopsis lucentensis TaxID=53441 RepID=UPI0004782035|nr:septum formation family protein [Nocardiopsis lucentensis]